MLNYSYGMSFVAGEAAPGFVAPGDAPAPRPEHPAVGSGARYTAPPVRVKLLPCVLGASPDDDLR